MSNDLTMSSDSDLVPMTDRSLGIEDTAGVLFQRGQTQSTREVGNAVHEMSQYLDQSDVTLEYASRNWL
jgi:hypothetical protein